MKLDNNIEGKYKNRFGNDEVLEKTQEMGWDSEMPSSDCMVGTLNFDCASSSSGSEGASHHKKKKFAPQEVKVARNYCSLFCAVVVIGLLGVGVYFLLLYMGWMPKASQNKQFQGTVSLDELALHDTVEDCWVAYHGKVYDQTTYANQHPGGASVITNQCGTDGTDAYAIFHSENLLQSIKGDYLGYLDAGNGNGNVYGGGNGNGSAGSGSTIGNGNDSGGGNGNGSAGSVSSTGNGNPSGGGNGSGSGSSGGGSGNGTDTGNGTGSGAAMASGTLTMSDVSQHNSASDCFVVYYGEVYDMTEYSKAHPGGSSIITAQCGGDGTSGFSMFHPEDLLTTVQYTLVGPLA
jgi:cytochrome b involved in lipid metabolism